MTLRLRFSICLVAMFPVLCGVAGRAGDDPGVVVKRLENVSPFAFGGVGFAGRISDGEIDFKRVLSQRAPIALAAFEELYGHGNPQAKSYALAGMKTLNLTRYKELLSSAGASADRVLVMRGCIMTREPLRQVAREIDADDFRF